MPALFVFLLKVNIALLLFCAGYYLVLRHLTFYTVNRVYLLAAIVVSSLYPKINLLAFAQRHEELVKPVAINWQLIAQPVAEPAYWQWITAVFWLGAALLTARLVFQLLSLFKLYKSSSPALINNHEVRVMSKDTAPFSFWKSIYVNPDKHEPADLKAILLHEQVHVNQWHTLDILLAELSTIFYWFNPGIWLIKKAVRENIEFITDQKILNKGIDSKSYQYSLVNVSFNSSTHSIVNHFNISTIKKRIIMMNAKRSSRFNLTRYALVLPVVFALLLVFSVSKADFAKPARVTIVNTMRPLAKVFSITLDKPVKASTPAKPLEISFEPVGKKKSDTTIAKVFKALKTTDSVVYYINGEKADLKNIDTKNVAGVTVLTGKDAAPYLYNSADKNKSVILITTKNSKEGKILMDEVNKKLADNTNNNISSATDNNVNVDIANTPARTATSSSESTISTSSSTDGQPNINVTSTRVSTYAQKPATFSVQSTTKSDKDNPNNRVIVVTSTSSKTNADGTSKIKPSSIVVSVDKNFDIKTSDGKTPLVILDGKEVSSDEVKKINPDHINRINVLKDETATSKYGDKAKNGVIEVTTKTE